MPPFFSIVIPLYNKADTIGRALRSVSSQTFDSYEVIVVDDGSRDNGPEIVSGFKAIGKIRLVRQENSGVSAARNRGVREACGSYIAFLDADDYWLPSHLADLKDILELYPAAHVISSNIAFIYPAAAFCYGNRACIRRFDIFEWYARHEPFHTSSFAVRRESFLAVGGYNEECSFHEDSELSFRLAEKFGYFYANFRVSACYTHDARETLTGEKVDDYARYAHFRWLEKKCRDGGLSPRALRCAQRVGLRLIVSNVLRKRGWRNAELWQCYPSLVKSIRGGEYLCRERDAFCDKAFAWAALCVCQLLRTLFCLRHWLFRTRIDSSCSPCNLK